MLVSFSRYKASRVYLSNMSPIQVWLLIFFYGCFMGYLYLVTHNIFVPAFMQSLLISHRPGWLLAKNSILPTLASFFHAFFLFFLIIILAHTYSFWEDHWIWRQQGSFKYRNPYRNLKNRFMMKSLLLVDCHNILYRSFFAIKELSSSRWIFQLMRCMALFNLYFG